MYRVRPIRESDLEQFIELAFQAQLGMTNLPKNPKKLKQQLEGSLNAFQEDVKAPGNHYYLFALEDTEASTLIGISAIQAKTGLAHPLEYYKVTTCTPPKIFPEVPSSYRFLERIQYAEGPSEICSLFLTRAARKEGLGKLLSFSRFLFIASFLERFTKTIFADMRGVILENGICPFWEGLGKHFLPIGFDELMRRRDLDEMAVAKLMPCLPIYLDLLPSSAVSAVGEIHVNTKPALQMLLDQGFKMTNEVDLYDAGPRIIAEKEEIKAIRKATRMKISKIEENLSSSTALIANASLQFRACIAPIRECEDKTLAIQSNAAQALEVDVGDLILFLKASHAIF